MVGAWLGFPPHLLKHHSSHSPFSQSHCHPHSHGQNYLLGFVVNEPPFVVVEISCRMSDMHEHVVDYSIDPNPYDPIWMCPSDLPKATTTRV